MTKSQLIARLIGKRSYMSAKSVEDLVKSLLEYMADTLANGKRIEVRGFGSFSLHHRSPRMGRNPKTGESIALGEKHIPHFRPGKALRDRVNHTSS